MAKQQNSWTSFPSALPRHPLGSKSRLNLDTYGALGLPRSRSLVSLPSYQQFERKIIDKECHSHYDVTPIISSRASPEPTPALSVVLPIPPTIIYPACRYFQRGYCSRGEKCHYSHQAISVLEKLLAVSPTISFLSTPTLYHQTPAPQISNVVMPSRTIISKKKPLDDDIGPFDEVSIEDVIGTLVTLAKDQHGCRFLQKKLEERNETTSLLIFTEIFEHISALMIGTHIL